LISLLFWKGRQRKEGGGEGWSSVKREGERPGAVTSEVNNSNEDNNFLRNY
jgi:hypothetical protein